MLRVRKHPVDPNELGPNSGGEKTRPDTGIQRCITRPSIHTVLHFPNKGCILSRHTSGWEGLLPGYFAGMPWWPRRRDERLLLKRGGGGVLKKA